MGHALKYEGKTKKMRSRSITESCSARALNETVLQKKKLWMILSETAKIYTQQGDSPGLYTLKCREIHRRLNSGIL